MRTVSVRSADLPKVTIPIGYVGENLYTKVIIDCKKDFDEHPDAVVGMTVEPPEGDAYPALVTRDGDFVVWDVSASDLVYRGSGSIQISFTVDGTIVGKTPVGRIMVNKSIVPDGEAPTALDDFLTRASTILNEIPDEIDDALEEAKASGEFDGPHGEDGVSPTVVVTDITGGHRITITDAEGPHSFDVMDGQGGGGAAIDDESTAADKVWSAQKVNGVKNTAEGKYSKPSDGIPSSDMASAVQTSLGKADTAYQKPSSGIPATDLASGVIPTVPVTDVRIDGTSILSQGVANIPEADSSNLGAVKVDKNYGIQIHPTSDSLAIYPALDTQIKAGTTTVRPLSPSIQHISTFYGLAKAAGNSDQSSSANAVGTYTEDAKSKISDMLNAPVTVSGSTPSITAKSGVQYKCGECSTLSITVPSSGCIDVVFESGSTATVLTVTPTKTGVTAIKWANGFDPSSLEANTTYELNILDGELGVACSWT